MSKDEGLEIHSTGDGNGPESTLGGDKKAPSKKLQIVEARKFLYKEDTKKVRDSIRELRRARESGDEDSIKKAKDNYRYQSEMLRASYFQHIFERGYLFGQNLELVIQNNPDLTQAQVIKAFDEEDLEQVDNRLSWIRKGLISGEQLEVFKEVIITMFEDRARVGRLSQHIQSYRESYLSELFKDESFKGMSEEQIEGVLYFAKLSERLRFQRKGRIKSWHREGNLKLPKGNVRVKKTDFFIELEVDDTDDFVTLYVDEVIRGEQYEDIAGYNGFFNGTQMVLLEGEKGMSVPIVIINKKGRSRQSIDATSDHEKRHYIYSLLSRSLVETYGNVFGNDFSLEKTRDLKDIILMYPQEGVSQHLEEFRNYNQYILERAKDEMLAVGSMDSGYYHVATSKTYNYFEEDFGEVKEILTGKDLIIMNALELEYYTSLEDNLLPCAQVEVFFDTFYPEGGQASILRDSLFGLVYSTPAKDLRQQVELVFPDVISFARDYYKYKGMLREQLGRVLKLNTDIVLANHKKGVSKDFEELEESIRERVANGVSIEEAFLPVAKKWEVLLQDYEKHLDSLYAMQEGEKE